MIMEKSKLLYIVRKGTNQRVLNMDKTPFIVEPEYIDRILKEYPYDDNQHVKITIEEYNQKFTECE